MQNVVRAVSAQVQNGNLEIAFSTGMQSQWPISSLQFAKRVDGELVNLRPTEEELTEVEIWPSGEVIEFSQVEQAFQVAALMRGEVGNAEWMKQIAVGVA
ncbi:MAG: hypothetical protein AAF716_20300 [Cyanobacteria bacterium P01_D01_bin.1]